MALAINSTKITGKVILGKFNPSGGPYWYTILDGQNGVFGYGAATDTNGNVYSVGYQFAQGLAGDNLLLVKYDSLGILEWQVGISGTNNDYGYNITVDLYNNIYVAGYQFSQGQGSSDLIIAKYNSSGTLQWQRGLGGTSGDYGRDIVADTDGNVYVAGYQLSQGQGSYDLIIAKYDTSGTLQWQRGLGGSSADYGYGITIDTSNNVYIFGNQSSQGLGNHDLIIAKYDTSGTLQWQRGLAGTNIETGSDITTDTSGNVYLVGYQNSQTTGGTDTIIAKYDTSGTLQWQRGLEGALGYSIATDATDNVYITGETNDASFDMMVVKYNSSGNVLWQREFAGLQDDHSRSISVDTSGNFYVAGYYVSAGVRNLIILKLPVDGSLTGTYGILTYQALSLTTTTPTLTATTPTLTATTPTLTATTPTLTATVPSPLLVSTTVSIP